MKESSISSGDRYLAETMPIKIMLSDQLPTIKQNSL